MVPRQPFRSNLSYRPWHCFKQCSWSLFSLVSGPCSSAFRPMARRLRTSSRLGCFSFHRPTVGPMQLSMSKVSDSDVLLGRVPYFLPCLSANGPTARTFGTTIQAVNLSGLHSVTRVPFFSSGIVSASIPSSLAPFAYLRSVAAPSVFS